MAFKEYGDHDGMGLARLVRTKEVSARELLDEAVARTARVDPQINAVVVKHYDYAKRQIDNGLPDGPFTGVPFLLKDLDILEGTRTTSGASVYKENVADHTSTLAQRFLNAGLTIFGKSATPEFGLMPTTESRLFGPTRNPWNLAHSSGGSSGGAAAAVAARILPVAHASDGGGSIRIPASASGVFGLKPTRARNPLGPDRGEGWGGFSCGHVVSISVRDSAAMLDAIHGPETSSLYTAPPPERPFLEEVSRAPGRLRIAFTDKSPYGDTIDPEIAAAVREVASLLAGLGHHVEERAPVLAADPAVVMSTIVGANTALSVRQAEARFGRAMTEDDFHVDPLVEKVDELGTTTAQTCSSTVNNRVFHATRATIAACMLIDVVRRRDDVALALFERMSREKNLSYPLTNAMHTMYQDTLYGVSACGCHHRGNGPDASQRPISHNRCGTGHRSRLTKRS